MEITGLKNVHHTVQRVEEMNTQYDFVVSRAVASLDQFIPWVRRRIHCRQQNELTNGILYLRGGRCGSRTQRCPILGNHLRLPSSAACLTKNSLKPRSSFIWEMC